MSSNPQKNEKQVITQTSLQTAYQNWVEDLLIYIVVLNLFAEYSHDIYFKTFTFSILTALVLKVLIVLIMKLEHAVGRYFERFESKFHKTLRVVLTLAILFFSKFFILEVIDIIFGKAVEIHGFVMLVLMIITMMVTRFTIDMIYDRLGERQK